jgi:hypothetical protein
MILQGDCLEIMPTLDAESVQCCVTLYPDVVQFLAPKIKGIAHTDVFIRKCFISNAPDYTIRIREISESSNFSSMFCSFGLEGAEFQKSIGGILLYSEIRKNRLANFPGFFIRNLIAVKWAAFSTISLFFIIPPTKRFSNKLNGRFVHHANLNPCMKSGGFPFLAFIALVFLYANITLPVDQSSDVSDVCFFHYITSLVWFTLL